MIGADSARPRLRLTLGALAAALAVTFAVTACSAGDPAPAKTVVIVETQAPPAAETTSVDDAPAKTKTEATADAAEETFTMPKVTGMVLQDAQDKLQSLGSYLMDQEDAMGWERMQLLDSNWQVCTQKPAAGKKVPVSTVVKLASVKLSETCP